MQADPPIESTPTTPSPHRRRSWPRRWWLAILLLGGLFIVGGWFVLSDSPPNPNQQRTLVTWQVLIDEATAGELTAGGKTISIATGNPLSTTLRVSGYSGIGGEVRSIIQRTVQQGRTVRGMDREISYSSIQSPLSRRYLSLWQQFQRLYRKLWLGMSDGSVYVYHDFNERWQSTGNPQYNSLSNLQGSLESSYLSGGKIRFRFHGSKLNLLNRISNSVTKQGDETVDDVCLDWKETLLPGDAIFTLTRDPGNVSDTPVLLTVFERADFPLDVSTLYSYLNRLRPWLEKGPAGVERILRLTRDWKSPALKRQLTPEEKWTQKISENVTISLLGISRPREAPMLWWNPQGEPIVTTYPNAPGANWSLDHLTMGHWDDELRGLLLVKWKPKSEFLESARPIPPGTHRHAYHPSSDGFQFQWGRENHYLGQIPPGTQNIFSTSYVPPPQEIETGFVTLPGRLTKDESGKLRGTFDFAIGVGDWELVGDVSPQGETKLGDRTSRSSGSSTSSSGNGWMDYSQSFQLKLLPMEEARMVAVTKDGKKILGKTTPAMYLAKPDGTAQINESWGDYPGTSQGMVDHFEMSVRPVKVFRFTDFVVEPPGLPADPPTPSSPNSKP